MERHTGWEGKEQEIKLITESRKRELEAIGIHYASENIGIISQEHYLALYRQYKEEWDKSQGDGVGLRDSQRDRFSISLENEPHALKIFLDAVGRGKALHPGPFTRQELKEALLSELKEFMAEPCQKCDFDGGCLGCDGLRNGQLARFRVEILDIVVVGYRFVQFLDMVIADGKGKQNGAVSDEKKAMDFNPR